MKFKIASTTLKLLCRCQLLRVVRQEVAVNNLRLLTPSMDNAGRVCTRLLLQQAERHATQY
ncbi:MAG: hypothetical protein PHI31_06415 [Desulfuromonadaceae bacterium]|nr:hypothetical protein [Desulfuromonadaceae bacterium]